MIIFLLLAGIGITLVLAARQSGSQSETPPEAPDPQTAAEQALQTFDEIVTQENYQALGFRTPEEVETAELGQPLTVLRVPLDRLQSYSTDRNPEELLVDERRIIYPITVDKEVRSSIAVEGSDQHWKATDFGSPKLIRSLAQFQQKPSDFIVQIPAFNLYFIARRSDNILFLTPIVDDMRFGFISGETLTATAAFETIAPYARDFNGLPGG
jgi:hypothetical protein